MGRADDKGSDGKEFDRARPGRTQLTHHRRHQGRMDLQPTAPVIRRTVLQAATRPVIIVIYVSRVFFWSLGKI